MDDIYLNLNNMKNRFTRYLSLAVLAIGIFFTSCTNEDDPEIINTENTVFMYFPWSTNLTRFFYNNIKDMESNICKMGGLANDRMIVFMSTSSTEAVMYEIVYKNGKCSHIPIGSYTDYPFTTEQGLTQLFHNVKTYAPAKNYSMIIGCHGMGWLPVNESMAFYSSEKYHYEYDNGDSLTRYFGGIEWKYQTDISTLSKALGNAGLKMEYILFDDCYMASIEVAYELKDVTKYLIASTCEVMAYGMPYATIGKYLLGTPDYKAVCDEFYRFYSNYSLKPYGTLSVTDCSQLDDMAAIMKHINTNYRFDERKIEEIQRLDGYSPAIFFDYGDYVKNILKDNNAETDIADAFYRQLNKTVPFKTNTEKYYTTNCGPLPITTYSGITTSDPSTSPKATCKIHTKWYYATH